MPLALLWLDFWCGSSFLETSDDRRTVRRVMDIWYQFAIVCGLIAAVGFLAAWSKYKKQSR